MVMDMEGLGLKHLWKPGLYTRSYQYMLTGLWSFSKLDNWCNGEMLIPSGDTLPGCDNDCLTSKSNLTNTVTSC